MFTINTVCHSNSYIFKQKFHTITIYRPKFFCRTSVRVGEYDGKGDPDCTKTFCAHPVQDIPVSHVIVHPGFERKVYKHDVALLVLKAPMNFSGKLKLHKQLFEYICNGVKRKIRELHLIGLKKKVGKYGLNLSDLE